jgi:chitin-binding protein
MIHSKRASTLRKLPLAMAIGLATLASQQAFAHGYVESPKSRSFMCNSGGGTLNKNCGAVEYEPQSIEYLPAAENQHNGAYCGDDFTKCGPADGHIAGAGWNKWGKLDEQSSTRWAKNNIKPGMNTFNWKFTAGHSANYYQFYITKKGWNPNQPLTRDSFELTPLLHVDGKGVVPPTGVAVPFKFEIPNDRAGYHVILATWRVNDTAATFYQAIDVNIENDGAPISQWSHIGTVQPEQLQIGDKVMTRVFTAAGEQTSRQTVLEINTSEQAQAKNWPFLLAEKVNKANVGVQMGQVNTEDKVVPTYGANGIFKNAKSDVTRVELQKDQPTLPGTLQLSGLAADYTLDKGATDLHFSAIAQGGSGKYTVEATVFNGKNETIAYQQGAVGLNTPHFHIPLTKVTAGDYSLVVVASPEKGAPLQKTHSFKLKDAAVGGDYDFVFPDGLASYKAGTKVLANDGKTYQCKTGAVAGWCTIYTPGSNAYEPGKGWAWGQAWNLIK